MELFSIKRYAEETAPEEQGTKILEKLLKNVEKRKRKKLLESAATTVDQPAESVKIEVLAKQGKEDESVPLEVAELPHDEATDGFAVLGADDDFGKRQKIDMVLPSWLAHPTIISTNVAQASGDTPVALADLPYLTAQTRSALKKLSIAHLFPVQTAVIPWIMEAHTKPPPFRPRDICVSAPTGSGKTLAFAIPVVQLLATRLEPKIRALVVLPVGELALQVFQVFKKLCEKTDLNVCLLSKQFPFALEQESLVGQYKGRRYAKADIVVSTPGRLVEHLHATPGFCLKALRFLVIDEADRIMDAVFQNWLYHLDEHVRTTSDQLLSGRAAPFCYSELLLGWGQPHKLLFSATLSQDPEKLQSLRLFQPKLFTSVLAQVDELRAKWTTAAAGEQPRGEFIGKYTTPAELAEKYCLTETRLKPLTLYALIQEQCWTKFLCFTNSVEAAGRLTFVLTALLNAQQATNDTSESSPSATLQIAELSASLNAKERARVLDRFARGKLNGLICSDALARGIDVPEVDVVVSYDVARHLKTYIHRIGRTARAGRPGTAVTLLTQLELDRFNQTLGSVGKVLTAELSVASTIEEQFANSYAKALRTLRYKLEQERRTKLLTKERAKANKLHQQEQQEQLQAPEELTLMQKLQREVNATVLNTAQKREMAATKANKQTKKRSQSTRKRLKTSAGKNLKITR